MDPREAAIHFEAVKVSLNQNKDGVVLRLAVHPQECPTALVAAPVGTRYVVALVELGDDEQPAQNTALRRAQQAVASAGLLCRNTAFQLFLEDRGYMGPLTGESPDDERATIEAVREILNIKSRAELRTNTEALDLFWSLRDEFEGWRRENPLRTKTEKRT